MPTWNPMAALLLANTFPLVANKKNNFVEHGLYLTNETVYDCSVRRTPGITGDLGWGCCLGLYERLLAGISVSFVELNISHRLSSLPSSPKKRLDGRIFFCLLLR